jgi:WD40 repeat protein
MDVETGRISRDPVPLNRTAQVAHVPGKPIVAIAQLLDLSPPRAELSLYNYRTHQKVPMRDVALWGTSIGFSRDGSTLAVATSDGPIRVFDTKSWDEKASLKRSRANDNSFLYYEHLAMNKDGSFLLAVVSGTGRPPCEFWSVGTPSTRVVAPGWTQQFALSPDDNTVALVRPGEGIRFANVATGEEISP